MKKFIASLIVVVMLCFSQAAYCAPFSVNGGDGGNDPSVMAITNPAYQAVSVPSGEYVVSGYAKCGAEVSVYRLNARFLFIRAEIPLLCVLSSATVTSR